MAVQIPIAQRIDELLHRRGDLSTFLVHLTTADAPNPEMNGEQWLESQQRCSLHREQQEQYGGHDSR
jgi:hypothetical protein